ncbi:cell surface hyaluronidase-like [Dreissena polymorpha]|uniref:CEMIP beta-helix domain-containing protein n=1 Tax=Dreissena polymorpha TaxID=45954 RepID=A0A9D4IZD7_DREPO|nr:cell surface hyaluronidase-like [Dreissena polymorpha]KAH3790042.1 hypothetical protein DPMN_168237 [Dreissena polymorpha]
MLAKGTPRPFLVTSGGTLEIHGDPKRAWTKLQGTLLTDNKNKAILYDHEINGTENTWIEGIGAYTVALKGNSYEIVKWGIYHLSWMSQQLAAHINSVRDGEILMMASQMRIFVDVIIKDRFLVYDALETLVSGEQTGKSILRSLDTSDGSTWAFIMQKGNPGSVQETSHPKGVTSQAVFKAPNGLVLMSETKGDAGALWNQRDNFRIASSLDGVYPRVTVIDDVTTWLPGDKVAIATTDFDPIQTEEAEIVFCGDCLHNQFRIRQRPVYEHYGEIVAGSVDMRAEVAMLTRKVVIRGAMEAVCPQNNGNCQDPIVNGLDTFGAHIKILRGFANARMSNFELRQAGQQTDLGRYPIHFHMTFNKTTSAAVPYIRSVSIHNTFARCITIHGSHGIMVKDNVCYRPMGHGFFLEDGGEMNNVFDGNLAMNVLKGTLEPADKFRPSGFWITNPKNSVLNNVAAGGYGNGIWFIFPESPLPPSRDFIQQEGLMTAGEAKRTMISAFENNLAHSQDGFGIMIGNRLKDDRNLDCCNMWQPLADPKNNTSAELQIPLQRITGYKNRGVNVWIEGGLLDVSRVSSADSLNGVFVTNEGQQFQRAGKLSRSVVIGQSPNKGVPTFAGVDHSIPIPWAPWAHFVQTGITMWKGPTKYSDIWFDKFTSNSVYDIAAIGKNRQSPISSPFRQSSQISVSRSTIREAEELMQFPVTRHIAAGKTISTES